MTIRLRHFTALAADWTSNNPVLLDGEFGIESDTLKMKIGNGSSVWTSLAYIGGSSPGGSGNDVYIQAAAPVVTPGTPYLWIDTSGGDLNFWVEDGV